MKRYRILMFVLLIGFSAFLFGCTSSSNNDFDLNYHEVYLQVGETIKLEVETNGEENIKFNCENNNVATIDEDGLIKAINNGETKIIVTQGRDIEYCYVYVGIKEPTNIYILSYDNLNLEYGDETVEFKVIFDSLVSSNVTCDWYINNELYLQNQNEMTFTPNKVGYFEVYAKYKELISNTLYFNVNKAKLVIDVDDVNINYLDEEQELTYKISEGQLCYEDSFTGTIVREQGNDAGIYQIKQGDLSIINNEGRDVLGNYDLVFNEGTYTINKIPQKELSTEDVDLSITSTKIVIDSEIDNLEFSLDEGLTWKNENVFEDLEPNNDYVVFIRIKETINHISSGVLELNAHTLKQYKVTTYVLNGNPKNEEYIEYESLIYDEGSQIDLILSHQTLKGYTFTNYRFIIDNQEINDQNEIHLDAINQDINIYALYSINIYEIKFISYDKEETIKFKYLDQISFPTAGEKLGYVFTKWINGEDAIDETYLVEDSLTLEAQYDMKNFVVAFYNSSQLIYSEVVAAYDKLTSIPDNPSQEGYKFVGWNTKLDGSGTYYYTLSDLTKIKTDLYLFAVYDIETYTVTYLDYDNTLLHEEVVEYGSRALYDVIPEREGYIFIGWSHILDKVTNDIIVTAMYQEI